MASFLPYAALRRDVQVEPAHRDPAAIAGLLRPDSGDIVIFFVNHDRKRRSRCPIAWQ